ncbi:hypothetical protein A0H81_14629 [Grifola frondosa]|uniref:Uncharacterized protein n=1 Tax=Grifola frondosa TaxID=5627 RepID=A0A1C7LNA6_GRIFR|nr:hypothetical protein A0H81_14629 [Grifola frondosa]
MSVIYKDGVAGSADLDIGLSVKVLADGIAQTFEVMPVSVDGVGALPGGWTKLAIQFVLPIDHAVDILSAEALLWDLPVKTPLSHLSSPFSSAP